nr:703_t:CDS:2 [Entrophospora candida]
MNLGRKGGLEYISGFVSKEAHEPCSGKQTVPWTLRTHRKITIDSTSLSSSNRKVLDVLWSRRYLTRITGHLSLVAILDFDKQEISEYKIEKERYLQLIPNIDDQIQAKSTDLVNKWHYDYTENTIMYESQLDDYNPA